MIALLFIVLCAQTLAFKVLPSLAEDGYGEAVLAKADECADLHKFEETDSCTKVYVVQFSADGPKNCMIRADMTCRAERKCQELYDAKEHLRSCTLDAYDEHNKQCKFVCEPEMESSWGGGFFNTLRYWLGRPLALIGNYRLQK